MERETKRETKSFLFGIQTFSSKFEEKIKEDGGNNKTNPKIAEKDKDYENEDKKNRFFEECYLKWKSTVEDIRIAKSQQWMTINYGFLWQFALMYWADKYSERWLIYFLLAIFVVVMIIFYSFQRNMREYRELIKRLEENFTQESQDLVGVFYARRPDYFSFWYRSSIPIMMLFVFGVITVLMIVKIWN